MTVTHADTTLLCKAWSFTEGFKPEHFSVSKGKCFPVSR
jgi:hypothetical protein